MPSKLKIKMGHVEFEYEGDAEFDVATIKDLFSHLESVVSVTPPPPASEGSTPGGASGGAASPAGSSDSNGGISNLAVNTVAARLDVKSGPELVIAAAATLQLAQQKESFTRKELLDTMHAAKTYYKTSMGKNLSSALGTLISQKRINELNNSEMSLSASEKSTLQARLVK